MTGLNRIVRLQSCEKAMGWCTAQCKMLLFRAKTNVNESCSFELACLKEKKMKKEEEEEENILAVWCDFVVQ